MELVTCDEYAKSRGLALDTIVMRENMEYRSNGIKRSRKRRKNFDFEAALKAL